MAAVNAAAKGVSTTTGPITHSAASAISGAAVELRLPASKGVILAGAAA
ncbi:MAG TPA: hypothetical protein VLB72_06090 [Burkholderiales bacterium]|nr:hypothetical protein [Burkholderiales bacterium]